MTSSQSASRSLGTACWMALFAVASTVSIIRLLRGDTDFGICLQAARELRLGGFNLYRTHATHGPFPYPHWSALVLAGLDSVLSERWLRVLFGLSQGIASVWLVRSAHRIVARCTPVKPWHWLLLAVLLGRTLSTNWTNGQFSLWVAALTTGGIAHLLDRRPAAGGVCLGIAAALKLTPVAFLPALPLMGAPLAAVIMALTIAGLVLLLPWPWLGLTEHTHHLQDFARAMLQPLGDARRGAVDVWQGSSASVQGTLRDLLSASPMPGEAHPFHLADLSPARLETAVVVWSAALALLLAWGFWRARRAPREFRLALQASLVCLAIALLSPLTRNYHLAGIVLPGLLWIALGPGRGVRRGCFIVASLALAVSLPLRQKALLGHELWSRLDHLGLQHLGLVAISVALATTPFVKAAVADGLLDAGERRGADPRAGG